MIKQLCQIRSQVDLLSSIIFLRNSQQVGFYSSSYNNLKCIGKFSVPKLTGAYDSGQTFLHRVFGYRGMVLFPWVAHVFDRDKSQKDKNVETNIDPNADTTLEFPPAGKGVKGKMNTFYQVLVDVRDFHHIRVHTETVTFLSNKNCGGPLYSVPGLDYVAHEDIMPFMSTDEIPIRNDLFPKFFAHSNIQDGLPFLPKGDLKSWQERNISWLELSEVHRETTENIRVTVIPFYMGCKISQNNNVYWWRYCIRLENLGEKSVQLRERYWRILSQSHTLESLRSRGVVGQEPILSPEHPAFQYSSHVSLQAPSGHMWGTFLMEREDGHTFECRIPSFSLESKEDQITSPLNV